MADCAFNTSFRRRAILAGGAAAISAPALAAFPNHQDRPAPDADPDAELLRLTAAALRCWAEYEATRPAFRRAFDAMVGHPDYPDMARITRVTPAIRARWADLAARTGYTAAAERRDRAHARYVTTANAAFANPARSLNGLCAKLRFAVTAATEGGDPDHGEHDWLRRTLADLERLAAAHG